MWLNRIVKGGRSRQPSVEQQSPPVEALCRHQEANIELTIPFSPVDNISEIHGLNLRAVTMTGSYDRLLTQLADLPLKGEDTLYYDEVLEALTSQFLCQKSHFYYAHHLLKHRASRRNQTSCETMKKEYVMSIQK